MHQDIGAIGDVGPPGEFARRVADAADARDEDHAHRAKPRHHLRVVAGAGGQAHRFQSERGSRFLDRGLNFGCGDRGRVVLDFRHKEKGAGISEDEIKEAVGKIGYTLKEKDIVLIQTGASAYNTEKRYLTDHCGMTAAATRYLISQGVRLMGIDAVTFDPPVWAMFERKQFWEAHLVMMDEDYWHIENMTNLDQLPPHGFKLSVFPIKWQGTTAAPVRAVAIVEDGQNDSLAHG